MTLNQYCIFSLVFWIKNAVALICVCGECGSDNSSNVGSVEISVLPDKRGIESCVRYCC